jgi:hypothetical protein
MQEGSLRSPHHGWERVGEFTLFSGIIISNEFRRLLIIAVAFCVQACTYNREVEVVTLDTQ